MRRRMHKSLHLHLRLFGGAKRHANYDDMSGKQELTSTFRAATLIDSPFFFVYHTPSFYFSPHISHVPRHLAEL